MAFGDLVKSSVDESTIQSATSCDLGSNPTSGNLLVFVARGQSGGETVTTPPTGFTLQQTDNTNFHLSVYTKISDGTEQTAGHTHSNNSDVGAIYVEYDMAGNTVAIVSTENVDNVSSVNSGSQAAGTLTPANATNLMLGFASVDARGVVTSGEAWDNSYTSDFTIAGTPAPASIGRKVNTTGSQTPTWSYTGTNDQSYGVLLDVSLDAPARSITNIDTDDDVQAGQTNVTITTVGLDASPATQTATLGGETLTVNSWSATAVNVDIPLHIDLEWGSTTNQLSLTDDTGTVTLNNVTLSAPTGWETVTYGGSAPNPATTESFYEYAQTDTDLGGGGFTMAANDILAWETQTGLTIDTQTIPIVAPPVTVTGDYKIWDDSLSTWTSVSIFTITDGGTFVDAPTLSSPTGAKNGSNGATGTVTTDESGGTLYFLASTNSSESAATIKASTDNQPVVATGVQNVTVTGLSASTTYYLHYIHVDSETNDSNVVSSASFTTDAASGGGFNSYKEWMESLPPGSFTTKLRVFLEGKGYSGSTTTMLYEYLKTVSSKGNHQERKTDWEDGGWN